MNETGLTLSATPMDRQIRSRVANSLVNKHALIGVGVGFIPVPGADCVGLVGTQLNLISRLSDLYGVPFTRDLGLNVLIAIVASSIPFTGLYVSAASMLKAIPLIGSVTSALTLPILTGAVTYGLGKLLIWHYEAGGDLFNIHAKADEARAYFRAKMQEGTQVVTSGTQVVASPAL